MRFPRLSALLPLALSLSALTLHAQVVDTIPASSTFMALETDTPHGPRLFSTSRVNDAAGFYVPPIANAPFSANLFFNSSSGTSYGYVARDSAGHTFIENHAVVDVQPSSNCMASDDNFCSPGHAGPEPPLTARIYIDPVKRTYYDCRVKKHLCYALAYPSSAAQPDPAAAPHPAITVQNLGQKKIDGLQAIGIRKTLPAYRETDDIWYSPDLQIELATERTLASQSQSVQVKSLKRAEPKSKLFDLPAGYKITSAPPPATSMDPQQQAILEQIRAAAAKKH